MELAIWLVRYLVIVSYGHLGFSIGAVLRGPGYLVCSPVRSRLLPLSSLLLADFCTSFVAHCSSLVKICLSYPAAFVFWSFAGRRRRLFVFGFQAASHLRSRLTPDLFCPIFFSSLICGFCKFCSSLH